MHTKTCLQVQRTLAVNTRLSVSRHISEAMCFSRMSRRQLWGTRGGRVTGTDPSSTGLSSAGQLSYLLHTALPGLDLDLSCYYDEEEGTCLPQFYSQTWHAHHAFRQPPILIKICWLPVMCQVLGKPWEDQPLIYLKQCIPGHREHLRFFSHFLAFLSQVADGMKIGECLPLMFKSYSPCLRLGPYCPHLSVAREGLYSTNYFCYWHLEIIHYSFIWGAV